jgi:alpha-beta hydrolase superfamily lysophospholipase
VQEERQAMLLSYQVPLCDRALNLSLPVCLPQGEYYHDALVKNKVKKKNLEPHTLAPNCCLVERSFAGLCSLLAFESACKTCKTHIGAK